MISHLRVLAVATGSLILLAAAHSAAAPSQAAPVSAGETRLTAPVELQNAQVRAAAGASFRIVAGY